MHSLEEFMYLKSPGNFNLSVLWTEIWKKNNFYTFFSATKSSVVASAVFVLHKKTDLISAPASCVHLIIIIFFVYFKILGISDPLLPIENVFKKIFLGGIFDTLQETFYGKPEESEESSKQGTNS